MPIGPSSQEAHPAQGSHTVADRSEPERAQAEATTAYERGTSRSEAQTQAASTMACSRASAQGLLDELRLQANALGFARLGVAPATVLEEEGKRLQAWVADGFAGDMGWMNATAEVRRDPRHPGMLPSALSVVVLVVPYAQPQGEEEVARSGRIARYALSRDYHRVLEKRAAKLAALLRRQGHATRVCVDRLPVFERAWAQRAGVGFVGKNCCLIVPGLGSHVLIACLVTAAELPTNEPMEPRCGSCRACLDACPTKAFVAPHRLDARRCIAYLTIETKGQVSPELEAATGEWLFGCDLCQDVCPFNQGGARRVEAQADLATHTAAALAPLQAWPELDDESFAALTRGSPIRRAGRAGMARNASRVLRNRLRQAPSGGANPNPPPKPLARGESSS